MLTTNELQDRRTKCLCYNYEEVISAIQMQVPILPSTRSR